ncbi:MAG: hypothetical protein ACKO2K_00140, partial [Alphaproteobacteria bacterium]
MARNRIHAIGLCGFAASVAGVVLVASLAWAAPAAAAPRVESAGDVLVVHDDGSILTEPEPLPLAGRRLRFVPALRGGYATQLAPIGTPPTRAAAAWRTGRQLDFEDGLPIEIDLRAPIPFFGESHRRLFVHPDGAISLGEPFGSRQHARAAASGELLRSLSSGPPVVAALWNELV